MLEAAFFSQLAELTATDVQGKGATAGDAEDAVGLWSGKLTAVNHKIDKAKDRAATADDPEPFLDLIDKLTKERKGIIAKLEAANPAAANPAADALGEVTSLAELLAKAKGDERDEFRAKARGALRRLVTVIEMRLFAHGRSRLAFITARFRAGGVRCYCLLYAPPHTEVRGTRTPGGWWCRSFPAAGFKLEGKILTESTLPEVFAARFARYTRGEDGAWKCPKCRHSFAPQKVSSAPLRCRACDGGHALVPVVADDVTTGELP